MKTFLIRTGVFGLGLILISIPLILFSNNYDNYDKNSSENPNVISLQTKSLYDNLDILFVGSSYCYSSVNTKYLDSINISSFNLGFPSAGPQFYDLVVNDYFKNTYIPPKKILLLVTPTTFSSKSDNLASFPIHRYLENELSNLEIASRYNRYHDLILMYNKSLKKAFSNIIYRKATFTNKEIFNNKGYRPSDKTFDEKTIASQKDYLLSLKREKFDSFKVQHLIEIAETYNTKGSEVIFFELPINLSTNYFSKEYLLNYNNGLNQIKSNFKLISLNENLFNDENYRDVDHMNSSGANIATKEILRLLDQNSEHTIE